MMIPKFSEKLAQGLAGKWVAQKIGPPLVFWGVGVLAWIYRDGFDALHNHLKAFDNIKALTIAVFGLVILTITGALLEWLQLPAIRIAEGYWCGPFRIFRNFGIRYMKKRLNTIGEQADELGEEIKNLKSPDTEPDIVRLSRKQEKCARLDDIIFRYPASAEYLMPTHLGNLLRGAEIYPIIRYGLNTMICWPRLWLLMPAESRQEITEIREKLNSDARLMLLGVLVGVWALLAWWAAIPALATIVAAYFRMCETATDYGDLIRTAFDIHRFKLYEAMKWPLPEGPADEKEYGERLTQFLFRGTGADAIRFEGTEPPESEDSGR